MKPPPLGEQNKIIERGGPLRHPFQSPHADGEEKLPSLCYACQPLVNLVRLANQVGPGWALPILPALCTTAKDFEYLLAYLRTELSSTQFRYRTQLGPNHATTTLVTMPPQPQTVKTATTGQSNTNRQESRRPQRQGNLPRNQVGSPSPQEAQRAEETKQDATEDLDAGDASCWICAEPVKYYSVSKCDHRTCHICALRLRALYKKFECTFCKVSSVLMYNPSCLRSSC